jgi:hypothetical protein
MLIEAELEDALTEVRDRLTEEADPEVRANLKGRIWAYRRALECVREAREVQLPGALRPAEGGTGPWSP